MATALNIDQNLNYFPFAGAAGGFIKEKNWEQTKLGLPETWPSSLLTILNMVFPAPLPMLILWGDEKIVFYNTSFLNQFILSGLTKMVFGEPLVVSIDAGWPFLNTPNKELFLEKENLTYKKEFSFKDKAGLPNLQSWNINLSPVLAQKAETAAVLVTCVQNFDINSTATFSAAENLEDYIQKALEKKEAETRTLIENSMFPIAVIKVDTMEILRANEVIINAWGKGKNVIGKKYSEVLPEFEAQEIFKYFRQVSESGKPHTAYNQKVDLIINGETISRYFNYSFAPLKDETGAVYAILNTAADITELTEAKQKEENNVKELKLFKFMADNAADKLILINRDASFAYLNNKAILKWGYTKNEIKNLRVFDIDVLYSKKDFDKLFEKSFESNSIQFETKHKNKAGDIFPVEVSSSGLMLDGEQYLFVIARDVTERKKAEDELRVAFAKIEDSEKRFRESVKQAPFGIAIFKGEKFISEMANNDYYKIIERTEEQFLNLPLFEALPEIKNNIEPIFKEVYQKGISYHSYEFPASLKKSNGFEQNYFNLVYHPLKNNLGLTTGIMVVAVDITENVKAKSKLQESERQFRNMVMQSPVAITILRGDNFIIETANKVMLEKILGCNKEEVLGKPMFTIFPELADEEFLSLLEAVYKNGKNITLEAAPLLIKTKDASGRKLVDVNFTPMPATDNTPAGIMITANDVTDKVEARKNAEDSIERLRLATEAAEMGTWELDLINKNLINSTQLAVIFGEEDDYKLDFDSLRNKFYKNDLEEIVQPAFAKALINGHYFYEARIKNKIKNLVWIRTQGRVVFNAAKEAVKMIGTTIDITPEKLFTEKLEKSEEKFRLLANEIPQLIWTANALGEIIYYNQSVYEYSGLTEKELLNEGWLKIVHPDERKENELKWKNAVNKGTEFLFEHRFRKADGTYRWQLSRAIPQRNEHGEIQAWVGSSTDIQEIKEQEEQKDFFISMASHELKTPVTSIKGYVQILQSIYENSEDKFLKDSLAVVDRQIVTLTKLITELLDISKIKSNGLDISKKEFEMPELIKEIVQQVKHSNTQSIIDLNLVAEAKVFADRDRIAQVLINLLTNAIKYTTNTRRIEIFCRVENDQVFVSIADQGIGISKKDQSKIFERFYRVEGKNEQTYPGFGIGLFIASEILKKHKGEIMVESELGKGSIFSFSLPLYI